MRGLPARSRDAGLAALSPASRAGEVVRRRRSVALAKRGSRSRLFPPSVPMLEFQDELPPEWAMRLWETLKPPAPLTEAVIVEVEPATALFQMMQLVRDVVPKIPWWIAPPLWAAELPLKVQLTKPGEAERSLTIAPPSKSAEFPWKRQLVRKGVEAILFIAPPLPEELPKKVQLVRTADEELLLIAPPLLAEELVRNLQLVKAGFEELKL